MSNVFGKMTAIPQWFLWRMVWDAEEKKYQKKPCALTGTKYHIDHSVPENWHSYSDTATALQNLWVQCPPIPDPTPGHLTYTLGFFLTAECGLWFFDLDDAVQNGVLLPKAAELVGRFPGAMVEYSSSYRGLHVIGSGPVPPHRTKPPKETARHLAPLKLEFYNEGRGIAFGFALAQATGSADTLHDTTALINEFFPYSEKKEGSSERRPEWRGPEDDDELIARFLSARMGAGVMFGNKASLPQLWAGDAEKTNDNDMSLAAHLAFWTGCDGDRIERLMRRSGMYREKWDTHRTYLRQLTINNACASCERVYVEPQQTALAEMIGQTIGGMQIITDSNFSGTPETVTTVISPEMTEKVGLLLNDIAACGTYEAIFNEIIPKVQAAGVSRVFIERIAQAVNKKLDFFDAKMPIGQLRTLLAPPVQSAHVGDAPLWMQAHCFIKKTETFYNCETTSEGSVMAFNAEWSRLMPPKPNSAKREVPSEWAFQRWNVMIVDDRMYHPLQPQYFDWAGKTYVNTFRSASLPQFETYTPDCVAMIERFNQHLFLLCNKRQDVYNHLIQWIAFNVQFPGRKIRWSPLIKGVQGDGKSIIGAVLRAALGMANIRITDTSVLKNAGGFTDWATGYCVNMIEEIRLHGSMRYELLERMKMFVESDYINLNFKGKTDGQLPNVTNHLALTNFNDALPLDVGDRRWMVIISPNSDIWDAVRDRGLSSPDELPTYFGGIAESCRAHPGQWRQWLCAIDVSQFDPNGRAPHTPEKHRMAATSRDSAEEILDQILEDGGIGIHRDAFCSSVLSATLRNRALTTATEIPKSSAWNAMLARLGYEKMEKVIKWNGQAHRVWAKSSVVQDLERVRQILDSTRQPVTVQH
ncbi:DNA primase [Stenotrophomonas phage Silvanus]|nr:DNA primase [Stenotrophomonas phage Silvanus]